MGTTHVLGRVLASLIVGVFACLFWSAQALASAIVRFIHAVPGAGSANVSVNAKNGTTNLGSVSFGQATPWRSISSGQFHWSLGGASKTLASGTASLGDGAFDVVVLLRGDKVFLGIYEAEGGKPGASLVRVIHAAPELGSPSVTVDGKPVATHLSYTEATPYLTLTPGRHDLAAMAAGKSAPLVSVPGASFQAGVSYSAIVVGTRGQMTRVITLADRGGPAIKPATPPAPPPTPPTPTGGGPGEESSGTVTVRAGDCLWTIARRAVGPHASDADIEHELVQIWDVNARKIGTGDPNLIYPGVTLRIPRH